MSTLLIDTYTSHSMSEETKKNMLAVSYYTPESYQFHKVLDVSNQ